MKNRAFLNDLDVFLDTSSTLDKLDVAFFLKLYFIAFFIYFTSC